jgi:hypothetical protein
MSETPAPASMRRKALSSLGSLPTSAKKETVENHPWLGEANVHVAIANWVKTQDAGLLPKIRKLWFKVEPSAAAKKLRKRGSGSASKEYELDQRESGFINSTLSDQTDVSTAKSLECNTTPLCGLRGLEPGNMGFLLNQAQVDKLLLNDPDSKSVITERFLYSIESVFDTFPWPQFSSHGRSRGDEALTSTKKDKPETPYVVSYDEIKKIVRPQCAHPQ